MAGRQYLATFCTRGAGGNQSRMQGILEFFFAVRGRDWLGSPVAGTARASWDSGMELVSRMRSPSFLRADGGRASGRRVAWMGWNALCRVLTRRRCGNRVKC